MKRLELCALYGRPTNGRGPQLESGFISDRVKGRGDANKALKQIA
jgi:hypothetical protein